MARVEIPRLGAPTLRLAMPRPSRRLVAWMLVATAVLIPGGFWLRDSPVFAVTHVDVTGVSGDDAANVRSAIVEAAQGMSTLHVHSDRLQDAVHRFPVIEGIEVQRDLPHTLRVVVHEHVAVGALAFGDRRVAVAADGTILADSSAVGLPLVPMSSPAAGTRLADATALKLVALLGAAPSALRERVARVTLGPHGLTAFLVRGPRLYFGPATRLAAKWLAAASVLADSSSRGARYIELRVPEQPAAGGLESINPQAEDQGSI